LLRKPNINCWWCYPTPSEGWRRGGTSRRANSRATPKVWTRDKKW